MPVRPRPLLPPTCPPAVQHRGLAGGLFRPWHTIFGLFAARNAFSSWSVQMPLSWSMPWSLTKSRHPYYGTRPSSPCLVRPLCLCNASCDFIPRLPRLSRPFHGAHRFCAHLTAAQPPGWHQTRHVPAVYPATASYGLSWSSYGTSLPGLQFLSAKLEFWLDWTQALACSLTSFLPAHQGPPDTPHSGCFPC